MPTHHHHHCRPLPLMLALSAATALLLLTSACGGGSGEESKSAPLAAITPSGEASAVAAASAPAASAASAAAEPAASAATAASAASAAASGSGSLSKAIAARSGSAAARSGSSSGSPGPTTGTATTGRSDGAGPGMRIAAATGTATTTSTTSSSNSGSAAISAGAEPLRLLGSGVQARTAANCVVRSYSDFIGLAALENSRLWPSDCRIVSDSPPAFSWPQPADRSTGQAWRFELRAAGASELLAQAQPQAPRALLSQALPNGAYEWRVSYRTLAGKTVVSDWRRFSVEAHANAGPLPDGRSFAAQVAAKARPRVLPRNSSMANLGAQARAGTLKGAYAALLRVADRALAAAPASSPDVSTVAASSSDSAAQAAYLAGLRAAADAERRHIEALAYAARLSGESRYEAAAIQRLLALAAWDPQGLTSEASQPQANRSIHQALATGADLLWDSLSASQREQIGRALRGRLGDVMRSIGKLDSNPYLAFENTAVPYALESLMLATGLPGFAEAQTWLATAWEAYATIVHPYAGDDGSMTGSIAYGWWGLVDMARTLAAVRLVADVDMSRRAFVRSLGDVYIAFTAPHIDQMSAFGDGVETNLMYRAYAFDAYRMYAAISRSPEHAWYWRVNPAHAAPTTWLQPLHFMLAGLPLAEPSARPPTRQSWVFPDTGLVAVHNRPELPSRSSLFFRAGRHGSYNHAHADQNSFSFVSKGKNLLISSGYYDYYLSPHHATVTRSTRYKNAITFDGGIGQSGADSRKPAVPSKPPSSMFPSGQLLSHSDSPELTLLTGDAGKAYQARNPSTGVWTPLLTNAVRSIAYFKNDGLVLIYDWLSSDTARRWEHNYHALQAFGRGSDGSLIVSNGTAKACLDHHGAPTSFSQTSAWEVAPGANGLGAQHHARLSAQTASRQWVMLTVLREDCQPLTVDVSLSGSSATVVYKGRRLVFDQRSIGAEAL